MDVDSPNFDPKRYVLEMLKNNSIKDLIRKNNEMEEDIKIHDHEIQSLVFENYSKFISSIDTVREMKSNICKVDDKLKTLDDSMERISRLALKIDSTFSVKRKQIQKLDTINKDLQKLKNLCDFPNTLKQDLLYFRSLTDKQLISEASHLFNKSIDSYSTSYETLASLKDQPLISPIFKESTNKVDEIRTILRSLQAQFKLKHHSKTLREITRKLLIVSEDQVSVLRSYFLPWKERVNESTFKGQKINAELDLSQLLGVQIPQLNESLWGQVEDELQFLISTRSKTNLTEQLEILMNNHLKDIFNFIMNNYGDACASYCSSLRGFVQVNQLVVNRLLDKIKGFPQKTLLEFQGKMFQKVGGLGRMMLKFLFGRIKIGFLKHLSQARKQSLTIPNSQEALKIAYEKILNPLKQYLNGSYRSLLNDLQYLNQSHQSVFKTKIQFSQLIHCEVEELLSAIAYLCSKQIEYISEEVYLIINSGYSGKMNRSEKLYIESNIKDYVSDGKESPCWFVIVHYFLTILGNHYGKKIIENTQKRLEIEISHDYGRVFTYIKNGISKNLVGLASYYANQISSKMVFSDMVENVQSFIGIINIVFPQSRRIMIKKPSFLSETAYNNETEILTAKKMHIIDKKNPSERGAIVEIFIRKVLKQLLEKGRSGREYKQEDIYCFVQICYELSSIEEEGQVCAFYQLLKNCQKCQFIKNKQQLEQLYISQRKVIHQ